MPSSPIERPLRARRLAAALGLAGFALSAAPLAAPGPALVPAARAAPPAWLLGAFGHGFGLHGSAYYALLWLAFGSYLAVLWGAAQIPRRLLWGVIAAAVGVFALSAPLLSRDVFSYIAYARIGAAHGLNPYLTTPARLPGDAVLPFVGWLHTRSAYGPLFTLLGYPLGQMSVPAALWTLKGLAGASVLGIAALCARLAAPRGVDPRLAGAFVALNPLVLVHVVGGAHNDGLQMLILIASLGGVLAGRELAGGAGLIGAAALKASAAVFWPFALAGAARRARLAAGAIAAALAIAAASVAAFGRHAFTAIDLIGENQARTSHYSIPATASRVLGLPITPLRAVALAGLGALLVYLVVLVWRGGDWLRAAGWAALGLLCATSWLLPWYLLWALPLAALARDRALGGATLALCGFQLVNRLPL